MINCINESYSLISVEDILDGYVDNVDDRQIDSDIKMWSRFSKLLGSGKWYTHMSVLINGDNEYDPSYYDSEVIQSKNGWKLYELNGIRVISEYRNGINFLYFKDDEDAESYRKSVDEINNPQVVTEDTDTGVEFAYYVDVNLVADEDVGYMYDGTLNDLKEVADDQIGEIKHDALDRFVSKMIRELDSNAVSIKNKLNIDDFNTDIVDMDVDDDRISFYFVTDSEVDIDQLTNALDDVIGKVTSSVSDEVELSEYTGYLDAPYEDGGIPAYDEYSVEYSVIFSLDSLNIKKVEE